MGTNNFLENSRQFNAFFEYLLVAHPDVLANKKLSVEKNYFTSAYGEKIAAATRAHATIASFR
jgi:hypothetical protein